MIKTGGGGHICLLLFLSVGKSELTIWVPFMPKVIDFLQEKIFSCYQLMQGIAVVNNNRGRKRPRILPQLRVMTRATIGSGDSSSSSSSSPYKRRKLNNSLWVDDDKGSSD